MGLYWRDIDNPEHYLQNIQVCVCILNEGTSFGDVGLLENCKRTASVMATVDTHCIAISRDNYEHEIKEIEKNKWEKKVDFIKNAIHDMDF